MKRAGTAFLVVLVLFLILSFARRKQPAPYKFPELFYFPKMPLAESNPVTVEGVELGRYLFYDKILSRDQSISCSSCHKQEYAFSDSPRILSSGIEGKPMKRNTPALFNLAWYPALFWDGRAASAEAQVFQPVRAHDEMDLKWPEAEERLRSSKFYRGRFTKAFPGEKIDSVHVSKAIAQFLRTLLSYRSKYDRMLKGDETLSYDEHEGYLIVNDQTMGDCLHCHPTDAHALGTSQDFSNNGLDNVNNAANYTDKGLGAITGKTKDHGKFKIPSLRNLAFTAPYMHDGRFKTLEEVIDFYSEGVNVCANIDPKMLYAHQKGVKLSSKQKKQVLAFLLTMSDSSFITDQDFGDPFKKPGLK